MRGDKMQTSLDDATTLIATFYRRLFDGRISRASFLIRVSIIFASVWLVGKPITTILASSSQTLQDVYVVVFIAFGAVCMLGFASAYVKRLHDFNFTGWWALLAIIAVPISIASLVQAYISYRVGQDSSTSASDFSDIMTVATLIIPILFPLWKGNESENRFGSPPPPLEHLSSSKFNIIAIVGGACILLPTAIYVGLFQSGIWVGRGKHTEPVPLMESNAQGRLFLQCWNLKGVGAQAGEGKRGEIYRDAYSGNVFDFFVTPTGQIDIAMAGERGGNSYLADGFKTIHYGLETAFDGSYVEVSKLDKFMITAIFDDGDKNSALNYTTFVFSRNKGKWPEYNVVMSSAISIGESPLALMQFPSARGRLMVGDCLPR